MSQPRDPSDLYHALTPARLREVAQVLWDTRVRAATTALWNEGANKMSVGLHAWLFARVRLTRLAADRTFDWLSVANGGAHFIIRIGGLPVRFCSGDDETPLKEEYRFPSPAERRELQLRFASSELARDGIFFRILVESNAVAMPTAIYLAACDLESGEIVAAWRISMTDEGESGVPAFVTPKPPVNLTGARVETHEQADAREKREAEERERERQRNETTNGQGA